MKIKTDNMEIRVIELENGEKFLNLQMKRPIKLPKQKQSKKEKFLYKTALVLMKKYLRKKEKKYIKEKRDEELKSKAQQGISMIDEYGIALLGDEGLVLKAIVDGQVEAIEELLRGIKKELSEAIRRVEKIRKDVITC